MTTFTRQEQVTCGVDVGSTNTKAVALARDGAVLARASRPTPRSTRDLTVDAAVLLETIEDLLLEVCADTHVIAALSVVGIGEDGVLVDEAGTPLVRALAWFDPRREQVYRELALDLDIVADGLPVRTDAARTLVGWRWAARQPGTSHAARWVALTDYASATWTGRPFMSDTLAARTAAWSSGHRQWVPTRVQAALGGEHLLPEVLAGGQVIGYMRSDRLAAAGALGPECVVVVGGHDHPVAGWALHQMVPGAVLDSMGTAEVVVAQSLRPLPAQLAGVDVAPGIAQPGATLLCVQELARNMRWASSDPQVGQALVALVAGQAAPDAALTSGAFIPGASGGGQPCYTADAPADPLPRASAVVGALARLGELAVQRVVAEAGGAGQVYAAGGWSRSPGWLGIKQALTHREVTVIPEPEVTAVGAALLAARALDWQPQASRALGMHR